MNRRLMMSQQSKGFELVYDAASGVLPTDAGYTYNGGGGRQPFIENNALNMYSNGKTRCRYDLLTATASRKSYEVWFTPVSGTITIRLFNNITRVNYYVTTSGAGGGSYKPWQVAVYVTWESPFKRVSYTEGEMLKLRLVTDNEYTAAFINNELIYETHTPYPQNDNVANIDINAGTMFVHKMIYKEW